MRRGLGWGGSGGGSKNTKSIENPLREIQNDRSGRRTSKTSSNVHKRMFSRRQTHVFLFENRRPASTTAPFLTTEKAEIAPGAPPSRPGHACGTKFSSPGAPQARPRTTSARPRISKVSQGTPYAAVSTCQTYFLHDTVFNLINC